jgi:SPP1 family predicted phage head-tail adaptor
MYRPNEAAQMTTPLRLQVPKYATYNAVKQKTYESVDGVIMANFKTFGGTEKNINGVLVVEDTAQIVCWYRSDITSGCRVVLLDGNEDTPNARCYEILGEPENIEMRNQFLKFKVRRVKGGA